MLKNLSKIKNWIKKERVLDVIVFGSSVRGKSKPRDIDLCILIKDKDEKRSLDLIDSLGGITDSMGLKAHLNILTSGSFVSGNTLAKTLLNEGFSVKQNRNFASVFGFSSKSLFVYSLKGFSSSKRVKFHYVLKGRYGSPGILKQVSGKFLGTGSIIVPVEKEDLLREVFDKWEVKYKINKVLIS